MTVNTRELIEALSIITENNNIRVTVKSSFKASLIVAGTTFVGAIVMGPPGIALGATAGGIYSYTVAKGTFKSAAVIIRDEITQEQKEKLCEHVVNAFKDFDAQDLALLIPLLMSNASFQKVVLAKIVEFLTAEMRMQIID